MEGIQQMFAEFMGYDEYDQQLTLWCYRRRVNVRMAEAQQDWRNRNPHYERTRWQVTKAAPTCRRCQSAPAPNSVLCAEHKEWDRLRTAARRAKKAQHESRAA